MGHQPQAVVQRDAVIAWLHRKIIRLCLWILHTDKFRAHPCFDAETYTLQHDWETGGGRHCDICEHSQPVFVCRRCGDIDCGYMPGGPGMDHCRNHCTYRYRGDFT